jgi:hypothetical protein
VGCKVAAEILQAVVVGGKSGSLQGERPANAFGQGAIEGELIAPQGCALDLPPLQHYRKVAASQEYGLHPNPHREQPSADRAPLRGVPSKKQNKGLQLICLSRPFLTALAQKILQARTLCRVAPGRADRLALTTSANQAVERSYNPERVHR